MYICKEIPLYFCLEVKMLSKNKKSPEKDKTIHIPPIAVILVCGALIILCLIILIVRISSNKDNEDFKRSAVYAEAVINGKTMYTIDEDGQNVYHYLTDLTIDTDTYNDGGEYSFRLDLTTPELENLEPGQTIGVYYNPDDPTQCRPASDIPNYGLLYLALVIILVILCIIAGININTLVRNIHGYTPKYTRPEDIGTMGEAGADNNLSDSNINYGASDFFSNSVMDSYSDPFATYSGYDDSEQSPGNDYYDPNSSFAEGQQYAPVQDNINAEGTDLNNPFASADNDPDNPYNQGNYYQPGLGSEQDQTLNDPYAIYGDGSYQGDHR